VRCFVIALALVLAALAAVAATPEVAPAGPRETTLLMVAGGRVAVAYGRPSMRGRPIFGALVPWGEIWRTGADQATRLSTELELRFGDAVVPAGEYALFTIPGERGWQLVLNKAADQWGAFNYDASLDVARVPMQVERLPSPLERLSIALSAQENVGTLWIGWETTVASARFGAVPLGPPIAPTPPQ
jgi:hypothetical protein